MSKDLFAQGLPSHPHQGLEMKRKHFREKGNDYAQRILNFLQRGGSSFTSSKSVTRRELIRIWTKGFMKNINKNYNKQIRI